MKYNFRDKKGRWITRDMVIRRFLITMAVWILSPMALMLATEMVGAEPVEIVHIAEAVQPEEYMDLCALDAIVCAGEKTKADIAVEQIPHETEETERRIRYLYEKAEERGIDADPVAHSIFCESMWYNIQSGHVYPDGTREDSWGLAQINLPSHPDVTREQAMDPYWAIDWKLDRWEDTKWYGYDRETDSCTNDIVEYWN